MTKLPLTIKTFTLDARAALLLAILFLSSGCGDSTESNSLWEETKQQNSKAAYLSFLQKYPDHSKAELARISSQDFVLKLVEKATAKLDARGVGGKVLTFAFVDVTAQWPDAVGDGKPDNIVATFKANKRSPLSAVLHWSWKDVRIELEGRMRRKNGGSFIHTEPLEAYPGHPINFPSDKGWYNYRIHQGGQIRLGLFFEGHVEELETISMFGQLVDMSDPASSDVASD